MGRPLSEVIGTVSIMTTTTDHPQARIVEQTLRTLAASCRTDWTRRNAQGKPYGIPEILAAVTDHDSLTFILAARALDAGGIDVWWNDLVCQDAEMAAEGVEFIADKGIDLERLYGPGFQAIIGIIQAGIVMDYRQIAALASNLSRQQEADYIHARQLAKSVDRERLLDRVWTDVQLSGHRAISFSPSHLQRHLLGVRALELAAAYYVLTGAEADADEDFMLRLLEPMRVYLFPDAPRV